MADYTRMVHRQTVVNDVRLHYVEAGEEHDETVVLLHGFPEFWYSWHEQIPALADEYHVVVPDLRGYNRSEKPIGVDAYRMSELTADVVELIQEFGDDAHLVGHDWGGGIAWNVAARHADVVKTLSVLNAPHPEAFREEIRRNPEQRRKSWYMAFFQLPKLPEWGLTRRNCAALDEVFETSTDALSDADLDRYKEAFATPGAATAAVNYYRSILREEVKARIPFVSGDVASGEVDVPTLLLWGEDDLALVPELTAVDEWVPDLTVRRIPDASHWVQLDAADRVSEELLAHVGANR
ncbi:Pimeloyl-ACP methyl ester carboxylesterase [Halogranum gelatinilyticum]|uniref:Pimeloyl-ACP methyl ester carboxylesterase n=1 Tax=Halogranum gelatinilyticum TaxID=660521 RepID=A0A1G9U1P2_9EURY|nr:alpha/beta hydrolase [Halogranum gelatinilyticum]SDM53960.1 Pimeloyl-ACP methyl ester carboxylesterase [Halogranum gelatinilyticum]